ncbi:hypothetical protein [Streptomyces sp. JJ36]|uniref:hypothetical protein n=1 Tax=Streptomyces sp. JJ36 TaxID=2736645 RepID=UPI001F1EFB9C|nr:hypothetical protein [Streptomyces sp. JJ36]MCF6522650.1 hypothetical protein [Streptomyces sp. JJ36]
MRVLRTAAAAEAVTLAVLLANLLTVHAEWVSSLVGPLHGTACLLAVATARPEGTDGPWPARWRALIPGVGGLLALRWLRTRATASDR